MLFFCYLDNQQRPLNIIIDFEKAEIAAIRELLPNTQIHGCWFHFRRAVWSKMQVLGLKQRYIDEDDYKKHLKKFSSLAFCRIADVINRYEALSRVNFQNFS